MKNNKQKKHMISGKTKEEKRRLAFEKRNVKKEQNLARYGAEGGSALVMAKTTEFNRRIIAAVLAFVFVLTTIVVGYNFAAKADDPDGGFKMFESIDDSGFVTRKGIKLDNKGTTDTTDDTYDLRMEAYATAPIATKTLDTKTPLDIVMVMDQSGSMEENKDVYTKIDESPTDEFTIEQAIGKYYHDEDGHDYLLDYEECTDNYVIARLNGEDTSTWTAEDVGGYGRPLYYLNSNTNEYELVTPDKKPYYTRVDQDISFYYNFEQHYNDNNPTKASGYYAYIPDNPFTWRPVWYRVNGELARGYYYTLYYYTKDANGYSFTGSNAMNREIANGNIAILGDGIEAYRVACSRLGILITDDYYEGKDLYTISSGNAPIYNYMDTESGVLAFPAPSGAYAGSETYTGNLYTKGYQLFYMKGEQKVPVGKPVYSTNADIAYNVADENGKRLYEKKYISRVDAMKRAASQLITNLGETDVDARVSLVGFTDAGSVLTTPDLIAVKETDSDTSHIEELNGLINNISVSETNGSDLSAGLNTAGHVFSNDTVNDGSRKRIVLVFTDVQPNEDNNSWATTKNNAFSVGAALKDTYNASVCTVGICINDDDTQSDLEKLSSKYFTPTKDGASEIPAGDTTAYYFNITSLESTEMAGDTLMDTVYSITQTLQSPYTSVALNDANSILKDIISDNFEFPDNFTLAEKLNSVSIETASVDNYPIDGDLQWKASETAYFNKAWDGKTLTVEGFDYNSNYVSAGRDKGQKIIVTITGLKLKDDVHADSSRRIYSNDAVSGIYKKGKENTLFAAFPRPFVDDVSNLVPNGTSGVPGDGVVVNKYLTAKENGKYDLTVETYTTKTSTEVKEKVPTDFIVVADQSGSMSTQDMATAYTSASDAYLETIATSSNGYYYYDSDTGNYYRVYPVKGYLYQYYAANTKWAQDVIEEGGMDLSWFQGSTDATYSVANQYYYKTSDGVYRPVGVSATGKLGTYYVKLHYTDANGDTVYFVRPTYPVYKNVFGSGKYQYGDLGYRAINAAVTGAYSDPEAYTYSKFLGITTGMYINYPMYKRRVGYTELRYRDVNGVEHTVPAKNGSTTWEYCNSSKQALTTASGSARPTYSGLYQASNKITRLEALKNALTNFVTAVANEKDDVNDPVGNRIAIVGFSSDGYYNTELLTGENLTISGTNGTQKTTADANARAHYGTALVDATDGHGDVNPKITAAIDALTASGGTQPEDGLDMAYKILTNRSQKTYTVQSSAEHETIDRNVFVIFFTDGQPGDYPFSNMYQEANDVVEKAKLIKDYRVDHSEVVVADDNIVIPSLFSIGVFGESDGNPLTYAAHKENSLKTAYEYEPGWMETFDASRYSATATGGYDYQYLNRNWLPFDAANYGTTPNDTIYDYMSVVSSNYPSATEFMKVKSSNPAGEADTAGYTNYLGMVSGVRGDSIGSNRYYRMASNQDTLVGAFEQAVTMTNQTISSNQRLDSSSIMRDIFDDTNFKTSTDTTAKTHTVDGSMDKNGIVNFDESTRTSINLPATIGTVNGKTTVDVTGFDYLANYINYGNGGKKLVLTITNIEPKAGVVSTDAAPLVYSNDVASAMYVNNTNKVNNTEFPTPAITRHRYTLDVGEVNTTATFDVAVKVLDSNKEVVAKDADMLEDVMLVYPDGTRAKYSEVGGQTFLSMKNDESFYFENLPDTYHVQTEVTATDDAYNYKIYYDSEAPTNADSMEKGKAETHLFAYKDSTIHIISTRNSKAVTIREETTGSYGDLTRVFDEIITMDMPVISETQNKPEFSFNCTFNDDYSSFDDDLPKNADSYTAVFGNVTQDDGTISTKLIRIDSVKGNNAYSKTITDGKLPMKHGDVMTLTNVLSGNTVKVQEADSFDHDLFYYYGQDNISPSDIRLKTTTGSLMEGTHTFTLRPVDGTDGSDLTLTFVDGVVTNPSAEIDLGLYQRASVVNDDMSEAVLDIAGTTFTFDTETSDDDIAYIATIKQLAYDPPVQVTVDKTDMDILVINRIGDIAVTGIFDDSQHNWVIYVLAGIAILSAGAGAAYVYRRKRLTTER